MKTYVRPRRLVLRHALVVCSLDDLGPQARTVRADIPAGLPEVMADPAILERVIANLIGNALHFSPAATPPRVRATARGGRIELRVIDHGPGISKADRERVFLPFQRLAAPGHRIGVGLGLVVSRGLAEVMGATVEPEETPGSGLTMVICMPAALGRPAAEAGGARRMRAA